MSPPGLVQGATSHSLATEEAEAAGALRRAAEADAAAAAASCPSGGAEFEWRAGEGSSEEEDAGPLDDRVEGAIDAINAARDAMNARQLDLEAAKRKLGAAEAQTAAEITRRRCDHAEGDGWSSR